MTTEVIACEPALVELERAALDGARAWVSRMAWVEVPSKGGSLAVRAAQDYLAHFQIDEIDGEFASRAAALRRERPRLRFLDAIILAMAMVRGRILVTRNTKDFPAETQGIRVPYTL